MLRPDASVKYVSRVARVIDRTNAGLPPARVEKHCRSPATGCRSVSHNGIVQAGLDDANSARWSSAALKLYRRAALSHEGSDAVVFACSPQPPAFTGAQRHLHAERLLLVNAHYPGIGRLSLRLGSTRCDPRFPDQPESLG